jgi:hypothetical protein
MIHYFASSAPCILANQQKTFQLIMITKANPERIVMYDEGIVLKPSQVSDIVKLTIEEGRLGHCHSLESGEYARCSPIQEPLS